MADPEQTLPYPEPAYPSGQEMRQDLESQGALRPSKLYAIKQTSAED